MRDVQVGFLKKNTDEELQAGKIVKMKSEWCVPLPLASKKDGSIRKYVAYIGLNKVTERESWPLPNIEQVLDELAGHEYYSSLDGFQEYYAIGIKKEHVKYLGFRTPFGTHAYTVMPFGLKNAPHTFSRFVRKVYARLIGVIMDAYMDGVGRDGIEVMPDKVERVTQFEIMDNNQKVHSEITLNNPFNIRDSLDLEQ